MEALIQTQTHAETGHVGPQGPDILEPLVQQLEKLDLQFHEFTKAVPDVATGGATGQPRVFFCFNAIVRNEELLMDRRLENIRHQIDAIAITDTGSTDKTIQVIEAFGKKYKIPTRVDKSPFVNFEVSRTIALKNAESFIKDSKSMQSLKGDWYLMFGDADDLNFGGDPDYWLTQDMTKRPLFPKFDPTTFDKDFYQATMVSGGSRYVYTWMIRLGPKTNWVWRTPVHEYVVDLNNPKCSIGKVLGGFIESRREGSRSLDKEKYYKDALMFTQALKRQGCDRVRCTFYLAQSYRDCGEYECAYAYYKKRANMGGHPGEIYRSYIEMCRIRRQRKRKMDDKCVGFLLAAMSVDPTRLEAPYELASYLNGKGIFEVTAADPRKPTQGELQMANYRMWHTAWAVVKPFLGCKIEDDFLFSDIGIYDHAFYLAAADAALSTGKVKEGLTLLKRALKGRMLAPEQRKQIESAYTKTVADSLALVKGTDLERL